MTRFADMDEHGNITNERTVTDEQLRACPHFILVPEHYRANGICRCGDPYHSVMKTWGYTWDVARKEWV